MLSRRSVNAAGLAACATALGYAFYSQYVTGLTPCHLCVFQRVTVAALAVAFLVATLISRPGRRGVVAAVLIGMAGAATLATAGRHVWVQLQPPGTVPACGSDLAFMLDLLPVTDVILRVFEAGGECAKVDWTFLGLSMPAWVLIFAVFATVVGVWNNLRRA